jgi:membrane-bound lytic murein transglycosylase B
MHLRSPTPLDTLAALAAVTFLTALAGCASPPLPTAPVAAPQAAASVPEVSEQGETQGVPERTAIQSAPLEANPDPGSYAYREDARALASALATRHGLDPAWVAAALAQARVNDTVTRLIMPAATPTAKNWGAYRARFVEPIRVRAGVAFWRTHEAALRRAEASYGVPMAIIAGIIGVETVYGRNTGNFRVLDALTTLSLDFPKGRSDRSGYFQDELGQLLRLCADQGDDPTTVLGSYAGAIGLPQFMPGSIRRFGVDFDGDGRIDLRNNPVDAIGSVAHYLAQHGWQRGMPTHYAVAPPADAAARERLLGPDIVPSFTAAELTQAGAELEPAGRGHAGLMALVLLYNGTAEPTYVAGTDNFYAITRYNQSSYYALAVADLGEAVARAVAAAPIK